MSHPRLSPPHEKSWRAQHTTYPPPSEGRAAERGAHEGVGQPARHLHSARYSPSSPLSRTEQKPTDNTRSSERPRSSSTATSRVKPAPSMTQRARAPDAPAVHTHGRGPEARQTSAGYPLSEAHAREFDQPAAETRPWSAGVPAALVPSNRAGHSADGQIHAAPQKRSNAGHAPQKVGALPSHEANSRLPTTNASGDLFSPTTPKKHRSTPAAKKKTSDPNAAWRSQVSAIQATAERSASPVMAAHEAAKQVAKSPRAREPQARVTFEPGARARRAEPPRAERARQSTPGSHLRPPSPQRKPRKPKVYCGNNRYDPQLKVNGGKLEIGSRARCFQQGFGSALFQHVADEASFLQKFSAKYEPLVHQRLWYKNSPVPEGYQAATLSQCRTRGWGAGSAELARRLRAKRHGRAPSA